MQGHTDQVHVVQGALNEQSGEAILCCTVQERHWVRWQSSICTALVPQHTLRFLLHSG